MPSADSETGSRWLTIAAAVLGAVFTYLAFTVLMIPLMDVVFGVDIFHYGNFDILLAAIAVTGLALWGIAHRYPVTSVQAGALLGGILMGLIGVLSIPTAWGFSIAATASTIPLALIVLAVLASITRNPARSADEPSGRTILWRSIRGIGPTRDSTSPPGDIVGDEPPDAELPADVDGVADAPIDGDAESETDVPAAPAERVSHPRDADTDHPGITPKESYDPGITPRTPDTPTETNTTTHESPTTTDPTTTPNTNTDNTTYEDPPDDYPVDTDTTLLDRLPLSRYWLVVGGAFAVCIPLAVANTELGLGLLSSFLTAYALSHRIDEESGSPSH